MNLLRRPWLLYALFLALGLGAMGWVTHRALEADRAEREAQARARLEEKVRLALWRMDSTLALFFSPETARPWFQYDSFHREGGTWVASPLLLQDDPMVLLRFQIEAEGRWTSPLVPSQAWAPLARRVAVESWRLDAAENRLAAVRAMLSFSRMQSAMRRQGAVLITREQMAELRARSRRGDASLSSAFRVNQGAWTPFWERGDLFLGRQVWVEDREILQGTWLEWAAVKEVLMSAIRDLLPSADLVPAGEVAAGLADRRLSSLPVRLLPGPLPPPADPGPRAGRMALLFGWAFALLGAVAGALVLRHALDLSERRGAFASAVTHELRTPLTTFRLYTELLAKGMVPDPEEQRSLLNTLLEEADRLDHLVKNVLAFARLESRRESVLESLTVGELIGRFRARLDARAEQGGLRLEVDLQESAATCRLRTDPLQVEQILFNLVDNAAKYASDAGDRRVHLEGLAQEGKILLRVRDHGPGLDPADRRHLFRPFRKSAQKAARTAPGVGLGLALCRRLARGLGGDLAFDASNQEGAAFLLTLPRA